MPKGRFRKKILDASGDVVALWCSGHSDFHDPTAFNNLGKGKQSNCRFYHSEWWADNKHRKDIQANRRCWYEKNRSEVMNQTRQRAFNLKGLTEIDYLIRLEEQDGVCAICKSPTPGKKGRWHIDHDHAHCAGERSCGDCVRGLLCRSCNVGLGCFKDDPLRLQGALDYLSAYKKDLI